MSELAHLKLHRYLMLIVGLWNFKKYDKPHLVLYRIYSYFVFGQYVVMAQYILISVFKQLQCEERVKMLLSFYITYTISTTMIFLSKYCNMLGIIDYMVEYEQTTIKVAPEAERKVYFKYAKLNNIANFIIISATGIAATVWYVTTVTETFTDEGTEACPIVKGTMYQLWRPYKIYHWLIILNETTLYFIGVCITLFREIMAVSMMVFMLGQIKMLQRNLQDLEVNSEELQKLHKISFDEALLMNVNKCIEKHQQIIKLMDIMQAATEAFILVLYFSTSFEMAAFLFQLIIEKSTNGILRSFTMFAMLTIELFLFYKFANDILIESTAISDVVYNETNWYHHNQIVKKHLILMMRRSQKQLSFKAAALGDMSLQTFIKLIKLCYSIVAFLKTAYDL